MATTPFSSSPVPSGSYLELERPRSGDEFRQKAGCLFIKDPIHGSVPLEPVLEVIIDTVEFQRLRNIHQLGVSYFVYPGASHKRFEHSIGTAYLCGEMLETLRHLHSNILKDGIEITDADILCVKIAGLCHDLGHGPFSHVFDNVFMSSLDWKHEDMSCRLVSYIFEKYSSVRSAFEANGLGERHIRLITDLISGQSADEFDRGVVPSCVLRGVELTKSFLYEIVSNKRNGIDCDKIDYLLRDGYNVGININFDYKRFFQNMKIIPVGDELRLCIRDKEVFSVYELFHLRWSLFSSVYQHKTVKAIELMVVDAFTKADPHLKLSSACNDVVNYLKLSDSILFDILFSTDENLSESRTIIQRLVARDLYKLCGQVPWSGSCSKETATKISAELIEMSEEASLSMEDFVIIFSRISLGDIKENPIERVLFYRKNGEPVQLKAAHVSSTLNRTPEDTHLRVYCKTLAKANNVVVSFTAWLRKNEFPVPSVLHGDNLGIFTAVKNIPDSKRPRIDGPAKRKLYEELGEVERSINTINQDTLGVLGSQLFN